MRAAFHSEHKFTLIEMLIVIAIIVILAAMLGGVLITQQSRAKVQGQANQIKLILGALDQFQKDFGEYPAVNSGVTIGDYTTSTGFTDGAAATTSSVDNWANRNSLAYRLCQKKANPTGSATTNDIGFTDAKGISMVTEAPVFTSTIRKDRDAWAGSYLSPTDLPGGQVVKNEIRDMWGNALAFCSPTKDFYNKVQTKPSDLTSNATTNASALESPAKLWHLTARTTPSGSAPVVKVGFDCVYYKSGSTWFARPAGNWNDNITTASGKYGSDSCGFMGPNSFAVRGTWSDTEMGMPEVWSRGADGKRIKLQYNSSNTAVNATGTTNASYKVYHGTNSSDYFYDSDNVGGNAITLKIQ